MIIGDVTNLDSLISALDGCEFVYNFAGISDLNKALYRPIETVRLNILLFSLFEQLINFPFSKTNLISFK